MESGIWLLDCSKLVINLKNYNDVTICLFWSHRVSLVKFSYWSKFHVNIITGSGAMTIFIYKGLTRNLEIINTLQFYPISGGREKVGIPNLARMSLMKMLNAGKWQGYSIYRFWILEGKPTGGKNNGNIVSNKHWLKSVTSWRVYYLKATPGMLFFF